MQTCDVHEVGISSLMYVSRSCLPICGDAAAIREILEVSLSRNKVLRVTGALVYTELHFVQVLEGPPLALDALMHSIRNDVRHRDVTVVTEQKITTRMFADWTMVNLGFSPFLDRQIKPLISPAATKDSRLSMAEALLVNVQRLSRKQLAAGRR